MYRDIGAHGYDFERQFWVDALGHCVESGKRGVLAAVLGEEHGGTTEYLSGREYDVLSVFLTKKKKDFLTNTAAAMKWEGRSVDGETQSMFGVRDLDEDEEEKGGGEGGEEGRDGVEGDRGEGGEAKNGESGKGAVERKATGLDEEDESAEASEPELEPSPVSPIASRLRKKKDGT